MQKVKQIFQKVKTWISDHYHILFKSAAVNHLRIQELLKNPDGTYELTVKFGSYSELKNYQKKLRRMTISLSSAVAMVAVAFIVAPYVMNPNRSSASTFLWTQSSWTTQSNVAKTYPDNGGAEYVSKTSNIDLTGGKINMATPTNDNVTDNNYSSFVTATTYSADPATGNYSVSGTSLALKKTVDAICSNGAECTSGFCAGTCPAPCSASTTCGKSCIYDNDMYSTVQIGTQCWFRENLRNTKFADGTAASRSCYVDDPNCTNLSASGIKYGGFYSKGTMLHGAATVLLDAAKGPQGICPTGWHVPSKVEWDTLITAVGATNLGIVGANNFSALKTGYIAQTGSNFGREGGAVLTTYFWSASNLSVQNYYANLSLATYDIYNGTMSYNAPQNDYESKFSVRCIRD